MQDASRPIWFKKEEVKTEVSVPQRTIQTDSFNFNNVKLLVATPVHSEVSIHYTESLLTLQGMGHSLGLTIDFLLLKSSLVTQGRNLCVANFLNKKITQTYNHGNKRPVVEENFYYLANHFKMYGATGRDTQEVLDNLLDELFAHQNFIDSQIKKVV